MFADYFYDAIRISKGIKTLMMNDDNDYFSSSSSSSSFLTSQGFSQGFGESGKSVGHGRNKLQGTAQVHS